jgi:prevent-host-death family protein
MTQVTVQEAEAQLPSLIRAARQGEEIIITEGDQPVAKLVSLLAAETRPKPRRQFGSGKGLFRMAPDFDAPLDDFKEYAEANPPY